MAKRWTHGAYKCPCGHQYCPGCVQGPCPNCGLDTFHGERAEESA